MPAPIVWFWAPFWAVIAHFESVLLFFRAVGFFVVFGLLKFCCPTPFTEKLFEKGRDDLGSELRATGLSFLLMIPILGVFAVSQWISEDLGEVFFSPHCWTMIYLKCGTD